MDVERFREYTSKNTQLFSFRGANPYMRVVGAHDGDTIKVIVEAHPGHFVKANLRLAGIDACEMTSKQPDLHQLAVAARDRLIQLISRGAIVPGPKATRPVIEAALVGDLYMIYADIHNMDKYGRMLADIRLGPEDPETLNALLIREKLAVPYDGGHKM